MKRNTGVALAVAYVGTVIAANWALSHLGNSPEFPGAPHTVPVWFGLTAPSGVLFVGLAFTLRDLTQEALGKWAVLVAILVGAVLSVLVADGRVALASGVAFLISELADFSVYTPLRKRGWLKAVAASNAVGLIVDSLLFLWIAFGSLTFLWGQVVGKAWMTLAALAMLWAARKFKTESRPEVVVV